MVPSLLTAANWPIVGQLCWILGKVMNFIYNFLDKCLPSDSGAGRSVDYSVYDFLCIHYYFHLRLSSREHPRCLLL